MTRRSILTVAAAVLGLALSAALAWSASQLAGQRIGLASEPLAVTQGLAPHHRAVASPGPARIHRAISAKPAPRPKPAVSPQIFSNSTTTPAPVAPAAPAPSATASAPAAATTTGAASSSAPVVPQPPSGASRHRDDHHPDD